MAELDPIHEVSGLVGDFLTSIFLLFIAPFLSVSKV